MHGGSSAVIALRKALGIAPSPRWAVERGLIDLAIEGNEGARRILRRSRGIAAARAPRTTAPTASELRAALDGDSIEQLRRALAQLVLADLESATRKETPRTETEGGPPPPSEPGAGGAPA